MPIIIERMTSRHLGQIARIEKDCFSSPWSYAQLEQELFNPDSFFAAALSGQSVVGYIGSNIILDEMYITNIAVSPSFRRQGAGSALIRAVINYAELKDLSFISLEVRTSNLPAKQLYVKYGFVPCGMRKNFYSSPREDAEIFTLFLKK